MRLLRVRSFVDQTAFERRIQNIFCNKIYFQAQICRLGLMSLTGPNPDNLDLVTMIVTIQLNSYAILFVTLLGVSAFDSIAFFRIRNISEHHLAVYAESQRG